MYKVLFVLLFAGRNIKIGTEVETEVKISIGKVKGTEIEKETEIEVNQNIPNIIKVVNISIKSNNPGVLHAFSIISLKVY